MYQRYKERFGTAGVVLGVIALILALGGTALAASKLNGTQKKEVEKIAKKYAGKPGAPGVAGTAGTNGTNGTNGKDGVPGAPGEKGKDGTNGTNAEGIPFTDEKTVGSVTCKEGGVEVKSAKPATAVCNGKEGSPWTAGGTLPSGQTETGTMDFAFAKEIPLKFASISFPIPLAEAPSNANVHIVGSATTECPGSFAEPAAIAGAGEPVVCIYKGPLVENFNEAISTFFNTKAGVFLNVHAVNAEEPVYGLFSFAVTAG
jgi:hypothetical protein